MDFNLTLIGQTIAMIVFVWFCMRYIWPPLLGAIEARRKEIADGLAAADQAQKDLVVAEGKAGEMIKEARGQAAEIVDQAQRRGDEIVDEARGKAGSEGERLIAAAQSEIDQERERVRESLRKEVAAVAMAGAEQILGREIDEAANADLLEKLAKEL